MIKMDIKDSKFCNGDKSIFLSFEYNQSVIDIIRALPTRYWIKDNKTWEVPVNKLNVLVEKLQDYEIELTGLYKVVKEQAELPSNFNFKTTPFGHQVEGFNYGLNNDKWLLGDEQGLGKTKQVIDIAVAKKLQKGYKHCLIICGVNGLKWNWVNEVTTHSNESAYILGQQIKGKRVVIGSNTDKLNDVWALTANNNYFIITNVESLRNEDICNALVTMCKQGEIGMIAADEVHKMKNPASQQGKAFLKLQAETMVAMTGTPLMNNPMDLYIIFKWLGYEKHSFYAFKKHYCEMGGFGGYEIMGYKHLDELQEQLDEIMLRRKKEDVLDLPDKIYVDEMVEMLPKQAQVYKEVTMDIKNTIDQIKMKNNPLTELIRMRQATGYTGILSSVIKESAKLDRMEELVEDAVENGKQVVIFSNWIQITDVVYNRLHSKYKVGQITGNTNDADRQNIVNMYQKGHYNVLIGTIGAMGTGLTLTAGTVEIFMDEPWNKALKDQAEDRCHRIGAKQNVTIYNLICKDTIDERIHELVYKKGLMADALVDGKVTMDNDKLLDYLMS